jgi:hypothetical protein
MAIGIFVDIISLVAVIAANLTSIFRAAMPPATSSELTASFPYGSGRR